MQPPDPLPSVLPCLAAADRLARATDLWIRRGITSGTLAAGLSVSGGRRHLAGGMLSGLCEAFELDAGVYLLALYVCALLDDDREWAAELACPQAAGPADPEALALFRTGRLAAGHVLGDLRDMTSAV